MTLGERREREGGAFDPLWMRAGCAVLFGAILLMLIAILLGQGEPGPTYVPVPTLSPIPPFTPQSTVDFQPPLLPTVDLPTPAPTPTQPPLATPSPTPIPPAVPGQTVAAPVPPTP